MVCKYADIFGKPRESVHSIRLFDLAIVDVLATFLVALLCYFLGWNLWITFLILIIIGVIAHRLFCVNTKMNTMIFGKT